MPASQSVSMNPDDPVEKPKEVSRPLDLFATDLSSSNLSSQQTEAKTFGDYRLLRELARGEMGIVYEAEPIGEGERVALKTSQSGATAALLKLTAEFRIVADLAHFNRVRLGDLNTTDRVPFFTMEIMQG